MNEIKTENFLTLKIEKEVYPDKTGVHVRITRGRAIHAYANYWFNNEAQADEFIKEEKGNTAAWENEKAKQKEQRKNFVTTLKEGDIVYASWGYDQTNIDFYKVLRVWGKNNVTVRELKSEVESSGYMCGYATPTSEFAKDSELLNRRITVNDGIRISECQRAHKWNGSPQWCSWYA